FAIFRTRPGRAFVAGSRRQRGFMERMHGSLVRRDKTEVGTVADAGGLAIDRYLYPELRIFAAERHRAGMGENTFATETGQHLFIERDGFLEPVGADGNVRQDAGVGIGHGMLSWETDP